MWCRKTTASLEGRYGNVGTHYCFVPLPAAAEEKKSPSSAFFIPLIPNLITVNMWHHHLCILCTRLFLIILWIKVLWNDFCGFFYLILALLTFFWFWQALEKRQLISDTVPFFLYIQVTHLQRSPRSATRSATRSPGRWPTLRTLPVCWTVEQSAWQPESAWTAAAKASAHGPATSATWAQGQHKGGSSLSRCCCRLPRLHLFMSWYPTMRPTRCVQCFGCLVFNI